MLVSDFDFVLPEELIAQTPPAVRGSSRMLCVDRVSGVFADDLFTSLPGRLRAGDLLVLNDSRVLPARLFATRAGLATQAKSPDPTGRIEVLLTGQPQAVNEPELWEALVRPAKKVVPGERLLFADATGDTVLSAEVTGMGGFGERTLRFAATPDFLAILDRIGHLPLPPYIHRSKTEPNLPEDRARYQTVYAAAPGSSAAPTAGLHFTPEILAEVAAAGVEVQRLTLHVGLGTFQPVRAERTEDIHLHTEHYTLPAATADAVNRALREGRRIIAAGTTCTRTLEHCAVVAEAAGHPGVLEPHTGATGIFLSPGHRFRVISGLLTNFHLPQSTLLMLVSAFLAPSYESNAGRRRALAAYAHAVAKRYRFFSYGDCMLIL